MLKINENNHVRNFFNTVTSHTFFPKITLPTRFSDRNCTLIDNLLCKLSPTIINSKAGILMNNLSTTYLVQSIFQTYVIIKEHLHLFTSKQMTSIR